jgi:hypothetical protein
MAKYILFLHESPSAFGNPSPEEMQAIIGRYRAWRKKMMDEGRMLGSNKLMDEGGKHLRRVGDRLEVQDGPYAEAREVLGGYFMLEAADYDEAVSLANSCPHLDFGWIEVRQVHEMPGA